MRSKVICLLFLVTVLCMSGLAQSPGVAPGVSVQDEPRDLVDNFWQQEVTGKRLTEQGWNELTDLCIEQPLFPDAMTIHVISQDSLLEEDKELRTEDFAAFRTGYKEYGTIDPQLRFHITPDRTAPGVKIGGWGYKLYAVLTKEIDPKGNRPTGRRIWKILEPPRDVSVEIGTAIRYVRQSRDKTKNRSIRGNAGRTLATLARFQEWERAHGTHK